MFSHFSDTIWKNPSDMWIWWLTSAFLGSGLAGCAFAQCPDSRWLELSRKREWDYELKLTIVRWLIDWAWTYGKFLVWYLKFWEKLDFFGKVAIFGGWNHNSWTKAPWLCCNLFRILLKIGHDSTNTCLCEQSDRWLEMNGCCCTPVSFLTSHWANSFTKPTYIVAKCGENWLLTIPAQFTTTTYAISHVNEMHKAALSSWLVAITPWLSWL